MLKISSKGQITLPKSARSALGLKPGNQVVVEKLTKDSLVIRRIKQIEDFRGTLQGVLPEEAVTAIRELRDRDERDCI